MNEVRCPHCGKCYDGVKIQDFFVNHSKNLNVEDFIEFECKCGEIFNVIINKVRVLFEFRTEKIGGET